MARVTGAKTRQAILVVGATPDPYEAPERLELFDQYGDPINLSGSVGIPPGGEANQVLSKDSASDFEISWVDLPDVVQLPAGGTAGKVLSKVSGADYDVTWVDPSAVVRKTMYQTILDMGPLSIWSMSETTGNFFAAGSSPVTGVVGSPSSRGSGGPGIPGTYAADSGGTNKIFNAGDVFDFAGHAPFTILTWIRPSSISGNNRRIMGKEGAVGTGWLYYTRSTGDIAAVRRGSTVAALTANKVTLNEWQLAGMRYDGVNLTAILNGVKTSFVDDYDLLDGAGLVYLGAEGTEAASWGFSGRISTPAIFGRALSDYELDLILSAF